MRVFFVILARDASALSRKIREMAALGYPYVIICGERFQHPNVVYREPEGKYDAVNFGMQFVPSNADVVVFNDVDAEIHNFESALRVIRDESVSLVFVKVRVSEGPQLMFYSFLDVLRKRIPIAASGELMLVRHSILNSIMPLKRCKAEDSLIMFRVLEKKGKVVFCEECFVTTERTTRSEQEESYKRRTVGGIYQALSMSRPPIAVRLFYMLLPFASVILLVLGRKGYYWTKGILSGYVDYARGDQGGSWKATYS